MTHAEADSGRAMSRFSPAAASRRITLSWLLALFLALASGPLAGHAEEMRFALVIGNDEYKSAKLTTPVNDAGLVANALTAAGFTVTGARNLDQATLRDICRPGSCGRTGRDRSRLSGRLRRAVRRRKLLCACRCRHCARRRRAAPGAEGLRFRTTARCTARPR